MKRPRKLKYSFNDLPDQSFDKKTFLGLLFFFFAALVNPRDFPIQNVPLIYPAFLFFVMLIRFKKILLGFKKTKFLCILLLINWIYSQLLHMLDGGSFQLGSMPYLLEPLLIVGVAGAMTSMNGGTKTALRVTVLVITLSTVAGIWIYFIGEPVSSWRTIMQSSIGGNMFAGEFMRESDFQIDETTIINRNAGLSYYVFHFSYQLAVALMITLATLLSLKRSLDLKYLALYGVLAILFVGIITNTERATLLSVCFGLLTFFIIKKKVMLKKRVILSLIINIIVAITLLNFALEWEHGYTILQRSLNIIQELNTRVIVIFAAIGTIFSEPLGTSGMSDSYIDVAYRLGWTTLYGEPQSSHNHFANLIMSTGVVGVSLSILLIVGLWKKIKYIRLSEFSEDKVILACSCITCLIHSLTHNAGFFKLEPATLIVFGLLWGATTRSKYKYFKQNNIQHYSPYNISLKN